MANPTRATLRTYIRTLVSDSDSANYGLTDDELNTLLNEKQHVFGILYPEENVTRASTKTINSGVKSDTITLLTTTRTIVSASQSSKPIAQSGAPL